MQGESVLILQGSKVGGWNPFTFTFKFKQKYRLVTLHPPQFQHVPLYLEWAPVGVFVAGKPQPGKTHQRHNLTETEVKVRKEP